MSNSTLVSNATVKPVLAGAAYFALNKLVLGSNSTVRDLSVGAAAVAAGCLAGQIAGQYAPASASSYPMLGNLKGVEQRAIEVVGSMAVGYLVNTVIMKNDRNSSISLQGTAVILASDLIAELGCDFIMGRPLNLWDASTMQ